MKIIDDDVLKLLNNRERHGFLGFALKPLEDYGNIVRKTIFLHVTNFYLLGLVNKKILKI